LVFSIGPAFFSTGPMPYHPPLDDSTGKKPPLVKFINASFEKLEKRGQRILQVKAGDGAGLARESSH